MAVCLINLAGLPFPPGGFLAKVFIFGSGLQMQAINGFNYGWVLVGLALLTSIPAVYYYSNVCIKMIVEEPSERVREMAEARPFFDSPQWMPMFALGLCVLFIGCAGTFGADSLMELSNFRSDRSQRKVRRQLRLAGLRTSRILPRQVLK